MSILSSLYHGEIRDCPNATHNVPSGKNGTEAMEQESQAMCPETGEKSAVSPREVMRAEIDSLQVQQETSLDTDEIDEKAAREVADQLNCIGPNRSAAQVKMEGNMRPELFYTQQQKAVRNGTVIESDHTVASKLESKEEFPQG